MDNNLKIILIILAIFLFIYFYFKIINKTNKTNKTNKVNIIGGEEILSDISIENDTIYCTLEDIIKYNSIRKKWIYNNGIIYDITSLINTTFVNLDKNSISTIEYLKNTNLQDLNKLFRSIDDYNKLINKYNNDNLDNLDKKLDLFYFENLDSSNIEENKIKLFNKFTFIFIKNLIQFKIGTICPSGLKI